MDTKFQRLKTPDQSTLSFGFLKKEQIQNLIKSGVFKKAPEQYQLINSLTAYTNEDFSNFLAVKYMGYGFLFESAIEYEKFRKGKTYYETTIFVTPDGLYYSFGLNCEYSYNFIREGATLLKEYPVFDSYQAYLLKDGAVCFLRPRGVNNWYDGYWFPCMEDFKYSYKSLAY
jgi:hypothetical protein